MQVFDKKHLFLIWVVVFSLFHVSAKVPENDQVDRTAKTIFGRVSKARPFRVINRVYQNLKLPISGPSIPAESIDFLEIALMDSDPQIVKMVENIWVDQQEHVAADNLCHDGEWIHFKNLAACEDHYVGKTCQKPDLTLGPITAIERVKFAAREMGSPEDQIHIDVFHSIPLYYEIGFYTPIRASDLKDIHVDDLIYELVKSERKRIPFCSRVRKKTRNRDPDVRVRERNAMADEVRLLRALHSRGITVLNSPIGPLGGLQALVKEFAFISGDGSDDFVPMVSSPLCNDAFNQEELTVLASGEWSGNGVSTLKTSQVKAWQFMSEPLELTFHSKGQLSADCSAMLPEGGQ